MEPLLASVAAAFPLQESIEQLGKLAELDRFQASDGIVKAADLIAERLSAYGLSEVQVHQYACPSNWWTFEGPVSWTPEHAVLSLAGETGKVFVRYPDDATCLAAYSASTDPGGIRAPLKLFHDRSQAKPLAGAVLLIDTRTTHLEAGVAAAERGGAAGIIADALGGKPQTPDLVGARGRIELPARTSLFGFSVTSAEFSHLERAVREQATVDAAVSIHRSASMPLVEGYISGTDPGSEILIQAHLCHPRPGANDNCSGVAAALGLAATFASLPERTVSGSRRRGIRFLFGPEFVGTAAYIHDFVRPGRRPRPIAAINLDMVGENQALCGGPLVIELPPDHLPSPVGALAEHCLSLLPNDERSYSGAVLLRNWKAMTAPFVGASDHGVHDDRSVAIPSLLIGHWPDRFNHTSYDTLDKVDPAELRRAATIAGACALTLSVADANMHEELSLIVVQHTLNRLLAASKLTQRVGADAGVFSPSAAACRAEFMDFLAECGKMQIAALERITGGQNSRSRDAIEEQRRLLCALLDLPPRRLSFSCVAPGTIVERSWPGPFNVRALLERATGPHVDRIRRRLWTDKGSYAAVLALALAIDDRSSRADIVRRAAYGSMLDIDLAFADDVFEAVIASGWAHERPAQGP